MLFTLKNCQVAMALLFFFLGFEARAATVTLSLSTDSNQRVIQRNGILTSSNVPNQGLQFTLTVTVSDTNPATLDITQVKKAGGTGEAYMGATGIATSTQVTTSGGTPNTATVILRANTRGAYQDDFTLKASIGGVDQAAEDATVIDVNLSPLCVELSDQRPVKQTATVVPALANVNVVSQSFARSPLGDEHFTSATSLLNPPPFPPTDATGVAARVLSPCGSNTYMMVSNQVVTNNTSDNARTGDFCDTNDCSNPYCPIDPYTDPAKETDSYGVCQDRSKEDASLGARKNEQCGSVDLADGEKKLDLEDLRIKGRGIDYVFREVYRGFNYRKGLAAKGAPIVNDFGENWTYSYANDYLVKDGASQDTATYLHFRAGQNANVFVNTGTGSWDSNLKHFVRLRKNPNTGDFEIRKEDGGIRKYNNFDTLTTPNKNGRLKELRDRNDNFLSFLYEQIDPDNTVTGDEKFVLTRVVDTLGREIRYRYYAKTDQSSGLRTLAVATTNAGAFGRLQKVIDFKDNMDFSGTPTQTQDFPGQVRNRTLVFDYDSEGNLARVSSPVVAATPQLNDFSSGKTSRYKYIMEADLPALVPGWAGLTSAQQDVARKLLLHKLTRIWYPNEVKNSAGSNPPDTDAAEVITYNTSPSFTPANSTFLTQGTLLGYATSYFAGGSNGNGVPSAERLPIRIRTSIPTATCSMPWSTILRGSIRSRRCRWT